MPADFHCLNQERSWRRRYSFAWVSLVTYGCAAFAIGGDGALAITAQALFFLAAFPIILWRVRAAFQSQCYRSYAQPASE